MEKVGKSVVGAVHAASAFVAMRSTVSGVASGPRPGSEKPNSTDVLREKGASRTRRRLWYH